MKEFIPSIYIEGIVIEKIDSRDDFENRDDDYVTKELYVIAEQNEIKNWELVAYVEVESCEINEEGEDDGENHPPVEVYRIPFPFDINTRIAMLRLIKKQPKFYKH